MFAELARRDENGVDLDVLVWRLRRPMLAASTTASGGGVGWRHWVFNAEVPHDYHRVDIDQHVCEIASALALKGRGVAMLTAAKVCRYQRSCEEDLEVEVTVGLSNPTWAASDERTTTIESPPGTVNIVVFVPVRLDEGALLNAIATATEAKSQALWDAGIHATGTPSDALSILCPSEGDPERFAGPRSTWGARLARCVHYSVLAGARLATAC